MRSVFGLVNVCSAARLTAMTTPTPASAQLQPELAQLAVVDRRRRAGHRVRPAGRLRERDGVADRLAAEQDRDDAVDAERDAAVRRRAEAQRVEQEAEARLRFLGTHADQAEHLLLRVG